MILVTTQETRFFLYIFLYKVVMYRLYKYSQRICQGQESSQGLRLRQKEEYSLYLNKYIYLNKNIF